MAEKSKEAQKFDKAMQALVKVPKAELDAAERRYQAAKKKRKQDKTKKK